MTQERACEDCGDPMVAGARRSRCPKCGMLVCVWCMHHVHALPGKTWADAVKDQIAAALAAVDALPHTRPEVTT